MISYRFNFFCLQVQYFNSFRFNFCLLLFPRLSIPSSPGSIFHLLQVQFFIISRFNIPCFLSLIFHVLHVQYSMLSRFNIPFSPGSVFHVLQVQYSRCSSCTKTIILRGFSTPSRISFRVFLRNNIKRDNYKLSWWTRE